MTDTLDRPDGPPSTSLNIGNVVLFEAGDMCIHVIHWNGGGGHGTE